MIGEFYTFYMEKYQLAAVLLYFLTAWVFVTWKDKKQKAYCRAVLKSWVSKAYAYIGVIGSDLRYRVLIGTSWAVLGAGLEQRGCLICTAVYQQSVYTWSFCYVCPAGENVITAITIQLKTDDEAIK